MEACKDRSTKIPRGCKDSPKIGGSGVGRLQVPCSWGHQQLPTASPHSVSVPKCSHSATSSEPCPHLQPRFTFSLSQAQFWALTDRKAPGWDNPGALCFGLAVTVTAGISLQMDGNGRGTGSVWLCGGGGAGGTVVMGKGGA